MWPAFVNVSSSGTVWPGGLMEVSQLISSDLTLGISLKTSRLLQTLDTAGRLEEAPEVTESITEIREERINVLQYFLPDALWENVVLIYSNQVR